jgi:acyl carrier protein
LKEAVVTVKGEVRGQEEVMAVWAVSGEERGVVSAEVREYLAGKVGAGMVPERITMVEGMVRDEGGRVDYRRLGQMLSGGETEYVAARNEVEEQVAGIWKQTLGVERVGVQDNFFRIGGHSLLATQVVARMSSVFGVEIALRRLFESPTVAELSKVVENLVQERGGSEKSSVIAPIRRVARQAVLLPQ